MGQAHKDQPSADATLADLETHLRNLQAEINRRLAAMDRDPLHAAATPAESGGVASAISARLARRRVSSRR